MTKETQQNNQTEKFSPEVPVGRFILLSLITFGIYELVWFYRNWKLLQKEENLKISPFWRVFFASLFAGSIAGHLQKFLNKKHIETDYSATGIGIFYFILAILWRFPDPYSLISSFTFIPMLPLVKAMNRYWQKELQNAQPKKFTWWQIILIILGIILLSLSVLGRFMSE